MCKTTISITERVDADAVSTGNTFGVVIGSHRIACAGPGRRRT